MSSDKASGSDRVFDVAVIGGGINGAGIAADASRRGYSVVLFEADDLAGATSSASSKLIHGGLRYLEHYAFRLVRESLREREILLAKAPHIIWPLRFVLPYVDGMRPAWMLRSGLFIYDHLTHRQAIPASRGLNLNRSSAGHALNREITLGFSYWDCWVDDARLVVANAQAAAAAGASIRTRTRVRSAVRADGVWEIGATRGDKDEAFRARSLVNAGGPWAGDIAGLIGDGEESGGGGGGGGGAAATKLRLVKGSHIVVPRVEGADDAFIFQNNDGRVVFALPFEGAFTLIGTTDVPFSGDPRHVAPSEEEERYLLDVANRFFREPLSQADIVWRFAGVRPLQDDGSDTAQTVSRDYVLHFDTSPGPPLVNVIGGKITPYRRLAENLVDVLSETLPERRGPLPAKEPLPGGDVGADGFDYWLRDAIHRHADLRPELVTRLARRYGTRIDALLDGVTSEADLGADLGGGLTTREVDYLKREEWAERADDVLWRRTKAGLHVPNEARAALHEAVQAQLDRS